MTDTVKPRRLGPKRASKIKKLFNLGKEDDVRKYVIRREITKVHFHTLTNMLAHSRRAHACLFYPNLVPVGGCDTGRKLVLLYQLVGGRWG